MTTIDENRSRRWLAPSGRILPCVFAAALLLCPGARAGSAFRAFTDTHGFIDVWRLREDVARVEALTPTRDTDSCTAERDGDEQQPPDRAELARAQRHERACRSDVRRTQARFDAARDRLDRAWRPALLSAIARGDQVAEVIWRQCSTTPVLDRRMLESTCDEAPERRARAAQRLREIGFEAAFDHAGEAPPYELGQAQAVRTLRAQALMLQRMAAGDLGGWSAWVHRGGNVARDERELEAIANDLAIDNVLIESRRAFTFSTGKGVATDGLAVLQLARRPTTPGVMTWRNNTLHGNVPYSGRYDWRLDPLEVRDEGNDRVRRMGALEDAGFARQVHDLLAGAQARIDHWLAADPRWAVFLLHRVGHHEWLPERTVSASGRLKSPWIGEWTFERIFVDLEEKPAPLARAWIARTDARTLLHFEADPASVAAVATPSRCELRYSGGASQLPQNRSHAASQTDTVLGYLPAYTLAANLDQPGPVAPFAPMDPRRRYRQVLVQCPGAGEWPDNRNTRFLFLAGDVLVEVMKGQRSDRPTGSRPTPLVIRHWRRSGALDARRVPATLPVPPFDSRTTLALFEAAAQRGEAQQRLLREADTAALIATLASSRQEALLHWHAQFPDNLQWLLRRPAITDELCAALRAQPVDPLVRFNLAMLIGYQLRDRRAAEERRPAAADCLKAALTDPHPWVRAEALWALSYEPRAQDLEAVRALQADQDQAVRNEAHETAAAIERTLSTKR